MSYCTVAQVQTLLGDAFTIPAAWLVGSEPDRPIDVAIAAAQQSIESITGNVFESMQRTLLMDGSGSALLMTHTHTKLAMTSVQQVKIRANYDDDFDTDGELIAANAYFITPSRRSLQRFDGEVWTKGVRNVRVRATFGYSTTPLPIVEAAVLMVREAIQPGYCVQFATKANEHFSDGYSYTLNGSDTNAAGKGMSSKRTTRLEAVDRRLANYSINIPGMGTL